MSLHDKLQEEPIFAPSWKPEVGDEIIGTVTGISEREGNYGIYPILTILPAGSDELIAVHGATTVLRDKIMENSVKVGDEVGVKYMGQLTGPKKGAKPYHSFRFVIEHASSTVAGAAALGIAAASFEDEEPF